MMTNMDTLKKELKYVQEKLIRSIQAVSRVSMSESKSEQVIDKRLGDILDNVESACVTARCVIDRYRIMQPFNEGFKKEKIISKVAGEIEVTAEGWLHIKLNTLLPNCRFKTNSYVQDTLTRLLEECDKPLPMFEHAFLAIVEHCDYENREVYDQDNKSWKMIPNAIKGRMVKDDEQFRLDIGLFSKMSDTIACHIYVIPSTQLSDFMYYLSNNLL
ncbi:MAG: hypothetical protein HFE51_10155 [Clostridia bacterium]|nr:hypothetical protein [Clostridia bacterium]MCI8979542.1 hypothetical protein [Clostridia bacterium]MCI9086763.1 hypothetical protein [Clostridia bacterium]NDO20267.1 hypothetical protein [Lachnospiraceae bacterium MD329]